MANTAIPSNVTAKTLIPLIENPDGVRAVMGRDLHVFLEVTTAYKDWFPRMVAYGFEEGKDFSSFLSESTGGRPRRDHIISLDMAKEISMIQRTDKGREARQYFIECEKKLRETAPLTGKALIAAALVEAETTLKELAAANEKQAQELETAAPKAAAYDKFIDADGTYSVGNVAKMLGTSQNKLFTKLRQHGILISKGAMRNTPYQKYMHHFAVKAYDYERSDGTTHTSYTTRVLPSGIRFISNKISNGEG